MSFGETRTMKLHGRSVTYVEVGPPAGGPVLLLVHGMAGTLENWRPVIEPLSQHATVVAVDLPGHGASGPGGGDYSLGALAAGLRDLLVALGHDRATLVGHSLGGGIAMQFAYQFPEMTERLALVSSGGLGLEVSPVLRAAALPGADLFLTVTAEATRVVSDVAGRVLSAVRLHPQAHVSELVRSYSSLADADRRAAFLATLRGVVGLRGQRVHAGDRLYLAQDVPVLLVWGDEDPIIPLSHGESAHELLPDSVLEVFPGVGHYPQVEAPAKFVAALERFCATTEPAVFDVERWRARIRVPDAAA